MARPRLKINPDQVSALASIGCTEEEMASVLDCSTKTLKRRFVQNIQQGRSNLRTKLRKKQIEIALSGNVTMLTWLGKNILGQADKVEMTGKDGASLTPQPTTTFHFAEGTIFKPPRNGHKPLEITVDGNGHKPT